MKKGFILFGFLITFILSGLAAFASGNYLHTITLEKSNTGYNVILGSDSMAKVMKKTPSDNELVLELSGITSTDTVNALYKGTNSIDGLVVENIDSNKLKHELGWEPSLQFEEGIEKTVRWYLDNQEWMDDVTSGDYQKYYTDFYKNVIDR